MDFEEDKEATVYVDTNLGTRVAVSVPIDITSEEFERKFEKTHARCLPSLREIRVLGIMVKRKAQFYYLAESMPIKYFFRDTQQPWFMHVEAEFVNGSQEPSVSNNVDVDKSVEGVVGLVHGDKKKKKKKSRIKPKHDSRNLATLDKREFCGPSISEPVTVSASSPLAVPRASEMVNAESFNSFVPKTPERKLGDSVSKSPMVGEKLNVAAKTIRMQGKSHLSSSLSSSIFRSKTRKMRSIDGKTVDSLAKFLVFDGIRTGFK